MFSRYFCVLALLCEVYAQQQQGIGDCTDSTNMTTCTQPASSVLFDGNNLTLTGLYGDMWASQLLTFESNDTYIEFDFTDTPDYDGVQRVELVMFNCPEWEIAMENITTRRIEDTGAKRRISRSSIAISSCSSLVRVCLDANTTQPTLDIRFQGFAWKHLAEVTFYGNDSTCPPDTIITSSSSDPTTTGDEMVSISSSSSTITIAVCVLLLLFLVCLLAAVLILWRCRYAKNHINDRAAVGMEVQPPSHASPVTLCEETGQVYYSTIKDTLGGENQDELCVRNDNTTASAIGSSNVGYKPQMSPGIDAPIDQLYAQVDMTKKQMKFTRTSDATGTSSMDQLYAQVDIKKTAKTSVKMDVQDSNKNLDEGAMSGADTPADQLYAKVDKKSKKNRDATGVDTPADQLYAQVDMTKKQMKLSDATGTSVDQLHAQVDVKKPAKMSAKINVQENAAMSGVDAPDQLYAQVDKKSKKNRDATEVDAPDQLYAQVDKKSKKNRDATGADAPADQLYAKVD